MEFESPPINCNGCRACCKKDLLILHPEMGDDPSQYLHRKVKHPLTNKPAYALQNKDNGECIYLTETGCGNYENRPAICREFHCGLFVKGLMRDTTRKERRKMVWSGVISKEVLKAGKKRMPK